MRRSLFGVVVVGFLPLSMPLTLTLTTQIVSAATVIPPENLGELAQSAGAVVLARALGSEAFLRGGLVLTRTKLVANRVLAGPLAAGESFAVEAPGGKHELLEWLVPGSPQLVPGNEYLLFLSARENGWLHALLAYGVLETFEEPDGTEVLAPLASAGIDVLPPPASPQTEIEPPGRYWKEPLLDHLAGVLAGREPWSSSALLVPPTGGGGVAPAGCAFISDQGRPFRWSTFDSGGTATMFADSSGDPSLAGGPFGLIQEALDAWMQVPGTSLNLLYGGEAQARFDCGGGDGGVVQNTIVFNDPCGEIAALDGCRGVLAFGGPVQGGTHTFDGSRWNTANGWIMVVNSGSGCLGSANYRVMLAHELGHGLGFGHVDDAAALMFANCCNNVNATDRTCASYTYPRPAGNERPRVGAGEDVILALAGDTLTLDGTASDDGLPAAPGRLTVTWTLLGGPRGVKFSSPGTPRTEVTFPLSGTYLLGLRATDGALLHADTLSLDLRVRAGEHASLSWRQGESGYLGTSDTYIAQSDPEADLSRATELSIDADDPRSSGQANQGLLRFDDLFGTGTGQIPPGAEILRATLDLTVTNGGGGATLHRMLKGWRDTDTWTSLGGTGLRLGTEVVATADASTVGTITPERVLVTQSLAAWAQVPCDSLGWAFLPRGTDGWDFVSADGAEPPTLSVDFKLPGTPVVAADSLWTYWKGSVEPPAGWNELSFEPGVGWLEGSAGLGYGDGDDSTVLDDMRGEYLTIFVRHEFEVQAPEVDSELHLTLICDDGAVVHLNGVEVGRDNMPAGEVTSTTRAMATLEARAQTFRLPGGSLRVGRNVLAASVHNADLTSSDFSFSAVLLALVAASQPISCAGELQRGDATNDGQVNLTDAVRILVFLFRGGLAPPCPDAADADDDGKLLLTDAVRILGSLFQGAGPLPAPGGQCGRDPSADSLADCETAACQG